MPDNLDHGYLALPSAEQPAPAVMVLPAWWGLNPFFKQFCERLAQAGFVAYAPDVYAGKVAQTIEEATALRDSLDNEKADKLIRDAVAALRQHPRTNGQPIGVVGFSMGAYQGASLLEQLPDQIAALVVFYGVGEGDFQNTQAAVLGHFAENDDYEPLEYQQAFEKMLKDGGIETTFHTYPGTGHWFFESNQPNAYQADAAELAWQRTLEFLNKRLRG